MRKVKRSPFRLNENSVNEIKNDEENINSKNLKKYFGYQNHLLLAKDLIKANQVKNNWIGNQVIHSINELRNAAIRKTISENENTNKINNSYFWKNSQYTQSTNS